MYFYRHGAFGIDCVRCCLYQFLAQYRGEPCEKYGDGKEENIRNYFDNMDGLAYNICYSNWMQDIFMKSVSIPRRQEMEENAGDF